jgi:hypothetical protein
VSAVSTNMEMKMAKSKKTELEEILQEEQGIDFGHKGLKDLEPLKEIEVRLHENFGTYFKSKIEILKDLTEIFEHRVLYFNNEEQKEYINDFQLYIQQTFLQSSSTAYYDMRIAKMLVAEKKQKVLNSDQKDLVFLLRRIVTAKNKTELLGKIETLDRQNVDEELVPNNVKKVATEPDVTEQKISALSTKIDEDQLRLVIRVSNMKDEAALRLIKYIKEIIDNLTNVTIKKAHQMVSEK